MKTLIRPDAAKVASLLNELDGYVELGMGKQALRIVRTIVAWSRIRPDEFQNVINTLGSMADLRRWKEAVEAAYDRQSRGTQRVINGAMFRFYAALEDRENALRFLTRRELADFRNAAFAIELLLESNRLDEAHQLAKRYANALQKPQTKFAASTLIEALAFYHVHQGHWEEALHLWKNAPLSEVFRRNALTGIVKIHLAQALQEANKGLKLLDQLKSNVDEETALMLPGNDEEMSVEAAKELSALKTKIAQLLPERWWHVDAANAKGDERRS